MGSTSIIGIRPEHDGSVKGAPGWDTAIYTAIVCSFIVTAAGLFCSPTNADELFQLHAQEKGQQQSYPAPQVMQDTFTSVSPALSGSVSTQVVLPPPFLGIWNVNGQRIKIDALPEFQQSAQTAFSPATTNTWEITGNPNNGYSLGSNTGVKTQLIVDRVQGSQAFIRYAHPIGNTVAQEAIVMQLAPGGQRFTGLERISILKEPHVPPRAQVTYQLSGFRQP
jgi:hypothetical protein